MLSNDFHHTKKSVNSNPKQNLIRVGRSRILVNSLTRYIEIQSGLHILLVIYIHDD